MEYRRASTDEDFQKIFELQNKNLFNNLSIEEKQSGFLSAAFTISQLKEINKSLCIMTCFDNSKLVGYSCAATVEYYKDVPLIAAMANQFNKISYKDKFISTYSPFISGPACVDKDYRGHGIYHHLINHLTEYLLNLSTPPDLRVLLVSPANQKSISVQIKMGLDIVGEFEFEQKKFLIIVKLLNTN